MKTYILLIISLLSLSLPAQNLEDYIKIALQNNPSVLAVKEALKSAEEKTNEAGSWNDTGINFGVYPLTPETRVGSQVGKIGISQEFPWFGTYKQAKNLANEKVALEKWNLTLTQKDLRYQIAETYFKMYQLQADIAMLKENKSILQVYEKMALGALENNKTRMSDILRIRAEKNALHAQIYLKIKNLESYKHAFNRLLNRDINIEINLPAKLDATDILFKKGTVNQHPTVEKLKQWHKVYEQEKKLIKKQSLPKFKLGTDYIAVTPRTDVNPFDNGKDVWMISLGLKIPLFNRSYKSRIKQAKIQIQKIDYQRKNILLNLQSAVEQAHTDFNNAMIQIMTAHKNVNDIQTAINADLKAYETGLIDYDRILRLQLQKIKFHLLEIDNTVKAFIANEKITYLTN